MAESRKPLDVCVLKVDLSCCSKCPIKVKNKFQEIKGVRSVSIDTINGEVTVCGSMDPHELQTVLETRGKKAEILAYDKGKSKNKKREERRTEDKDRPSQDKRRVRKKFKDQSSSSDSDSDDEPVNGNAGRQYPGRRPGHVEPRMYGRGHAPQYARPHMMRGPMMMAPPPPPPPPYWYPPPHPAAYGGGQRPMMHLPPRYPPPSRQNISLANLHAIYSGQKDPPVGNALYHKFSDENVNSCSIM